MVHRQESLDSLHFDYELILHDKIQAVAALEMNALVAYGKQFFLLEPQAPQGQLMSQASLVGRFEESGAQQSMHFDAGSDDSV